MDMHATNPFDIYLSFKTQEINAFKMPSREYNTDVPLRSVLQELKGLTN